MQKIIYIVLISLLVSSCGSSKKRSSRTVIKTKTTKTRATNTSSNKKIKSIIQYAKTFDGTRYKYGGTTKKGMDCSGLVYTSFKKEDIILPRTSRSMSTQGTKVSLKNVAIGDLLFFKTNKNKNVINHVGLVTSIGNDIRFIHASSSRGVTISSLKERYWSKCFVSIRRIL